MQYVLLAAFLFMLATLAPTSGAPPIQPETNPTIQARGLVHKYGWHTDGNLPSVNYLEVPNLHGLPFAHYQSASQAIGLDLTPALGRKLAVQKYTLTEKTKSGAKIYAYVAILDKKIVGAWVAGDSPVGPGVLPLSNRAPVEKR